MGAVLPHPPHEQPQRGLYPLDLFYRGVAELAVKTELARLSLVSQCGC